MDWQSNAKAFQMIEQIIKSGNELPLPEERVEAILKMKEPALEADIQALEERCKLTEARAA